MIPCSSFILEPRVFVVYPVTKPISNRYFKQKRGKFNIPFWIFIVYRLFMTVTYIRHMKIQNFIFYIFHIQSIICILWKTCSVHILLFQNGHSRSAQNKKKLGTRGRIIVNRTHLLVVERSITSNENLLMIASLQVNHTLFSFFHGLCMAFLDNSPNANFSSHSAQNI